jgi:hypothetical protein
MLHSSEYYYNYVEYAKVATAKKENNKRFEVYRKRIETSFRMEIVDTFVSEKPQKTDLETITKLLKDPEIVRVVTILDITRLSILELLEYGLTRQDINHALVSGVIEMDKETLPRTEIASAEGSFVAGDIYYPQFLSSKVKLTALGLYLLDCIKGCQTDQEIIEKAQKMFESGAFTPPESPHRPG